MCILELRGNLANRDEQSLRTKVVIYYVGFVSYSGFSGAIFMFLETMDLKQLLFAGKKRRSNQSICGYISAIIGIISSLTSGIVYKLFIQTCMAN